MSEIWYVDYYTQTIKQVSEKYKSDKLKMMTPLQSMRPCFFNSRDEAVAWKRRQIETTLNIFRKRVREEEQNLRKFDRKFIEALNK